MKQYEINGYYGSGKTPATVFVYGKWYAVEGSVNVNKTLQEITNGTNVEELSDVDMFTASKPIDSLQELIDQVEA